MNNQINIVLLPATNWVHSHLIPLFVLNQRYLKRMKNVVSYFVLPKKLHLSYEELGIKVLPIDLKDPDNITELLSQPKVAQRVFDDALYSLLQTTLCATPDVIIDDGEPLSIFVAKERNIPRISIHRTGYFRSIEPELRNPNHMHSMEKSYYGKIWDASLFLNPSWFKKQPVYRQTSSYVKQMTKDYNQAVRQLIDDLKATCANYGLGGEASEYKIVTQIFLYKFLNDKFLYAVKMRGERTITQKGYDSCSTTLLPAGSILLSSRAPIGLLAIAGAECCTNQGFKNLILDKNKANNEFLYYLFKHRIKDIEALGNGTTFKELSKTSIEKYELEIPDLPTQRRIATVLSALDEKIALNNRINDNFFINIRDIGFSARNIK